MVRLLEASEHFSLTLFLNSVIKWYAHFEEDVCWVQMANVSNDYHLPIQLNHADYAYNQQVVDPLDCVPGCHYYILHDPVSNHLEDYINNCIHRTYRFKGIVFQTQDRVDKYNASMVFAHSSIFVNMVLDTLVIEKFADWKFSKTRVLNIWNMSHNAFVHTVDLERYFDEKIHNDAKVFSVFPTSTAPVVQYEPTLAGSHMRILQEFTKKLHLDYERHDAFRAWPANASRYLAYFMPGAIYSKYLSTTVNRNRIGFIVPKKRIRINMTNIVEVFQWEFWMCTFVLYFAICAYLIVEKYLGIRPIERILFPVKLFCMQPLSTREISGNRRVKFVLSLLFFFALWISLLFNYGVLHSLMTPKYENDIQTWEDMEKANLPIYWHRDPLAFDTHDSATVKNVLARWTKDESILEDRQKSIQMHYISDNGLSSLLAQHYNLTDEHVISLDNIYDIVHEFIGVSFSALLHMDELNKLIRLAQESGLVTKWEWEAYLRTTKVFTTLEYLDKNSRHATTVQLTIDHLLGLFCGLVIGLSLASVVFCIECYIQLRQQRSFGRYF